MEAICRSTVMLSAALLGSLGAFPALADFFDDARQTFQKDAPRFFQKDVPHFFQDDIPCAIGGQPTSHTKKSCKDRGDSMPPRAQNSGAAPPVPADPNHTTGETPVYDQ